MTSGKTTPRRPKESQILEACLELAEEQGWSMVRLSDVADKLNLSLADIHQYYRDLDSVANAWFEHALVAMLSAKKKGFSTLPPEQRLHISMGLWLDALSEHRQVTAEMIGLKMHPPHVHHWAPMIFNLSRLIQWWLEAAAISSRGRQRQIAEIGLTALFLATFVFWSRDGSDGQERTKRFLSKRLEKAHCVMTKWRPAKQH